jgi:hypothetical protein
MKKKYSLVDADTSVYNNTSISDTGLVYNAKGDLVVANPGTVEAINSGDQGDEIILAVIAFNSNGNISPDGGVSNNAGPQWVTTGTNWIGGSNYTINTGTPTLTGPSASIVSPSAAQTPSLASSQTYQLRAGGNLGIYTATWSATIRNLATNATQAWSIYASVERVVGGGGGGGDPSD